MGNSKGKVTVEMEDGTLGLEAAKCHTMPTPKGAAEILAVLCQTAGYAGTIKARLGRQKYGTPIRQGVAGIKVVRIEGPNGVVVTVQPGSNDTHHEVLLIVPPGVKSAEEFFIALSIAAESLRELERPSRRALMMRRWRQLYRHFEGKNIELSKLDEGLATRIGFQTVEHLRKAIQDEARRKDCAFQPFGSNHEFVWTTDFIMSMPQVTKIELTDDSVDRSVEKSVMPTDPSAIEEQVRLGLLGDEDSERLLQEASRLDEEAGALAKDAVGLNTFILAQVEPLSGLKHQIEVLEAQLAGLRHSESVMRGDQERAKANYAIKEEAAKQAKAKAEVLFEQAGRIVDAVVVVSVADRVADTLEELPLALRQRVIRQFILEEVDTTKEEK